jgi:hypothetical protein
MFSPSFLQIHGVQRYVLGKFHVFSNRLNEGCSQVDSMIQSTCFSASTATIDSMVILDSMGGKKINTQWPLAKLPIAQK